MNAIISAIDRQVAESASLLDLARRVKSRLGWTCSDTAARREVAHMLSPSYERRHFPAECLPDVLMVTGRDDVLRELLAAWAEVQLRQRSELDAYEPERVPMRTVRHDQDKRRRA